MAYVPTNLDPTVEILRGAVPGYTHDRKFGRNPDIRSSTDPQDIFNGSGLYAGQPLGGSAETVGIASSDSTDNGSGVGARTITIVGLDENYALATETVAMHASDGTTEVFSSGTFFRVFRAFVASSGSSNTNAGDITIRHSSTTANVFATMPAGSGSSFVLAITVPADTILIMYSLMIEIEGGSPSGSEANISLLTTNIDTQATTNKGSWLFQRDVPRPEINWGDGWVVDEKTDILVRCDEVSDNTATIVSGEFMYGFAPKPS